MSKNGKLLTACDRYFKGERCVGCFLRFICPKDGCVPEGQAQPVLTDAVAEEQCLRPCERFDHDGCDGCQLRLICVRDGFLPLGRRGSPALTGYTEESDCAKPKGAATSDSSPRRWRRAAERGISA